MQKKTIYLQLDFHDNIAKMPTFLRCVVNSHTFGHNRSDFSYSMFTEQIIRGKSKIALCLLFDSFVVKKYAIPFNLKLSVKASYTARLQGLTERVFFMELNDHDHPSGNCNLQVSIYVNEV